MKRIAQVLAVLAVALSGCTAPKVLPLDAHYLPLERIREVGELPGLPEHGGATLLTDVLTRDMKDLLDGLRIGSVELEAFLRHEQIHAIHGFADPTLGARYLLDPATRWSEEKSAYGVQIAYLRANGQASDADELVGWLTDPVYRGMCTPEEARAWVQEQLK